THGGCMSMLTRMLITSALLVGIVAAGDVNLRENGTTAPADKEEKEGEPAGPPLFEDVTQASGIDFTYRNGEDTANHLAILESLGGGAGLIDFDGDGLLDLFLPGGGGYAGKDSKEIFGLPCK